MRISVVIPVKDDAARLEQCLRAVGSQSFRPAEIVVVDNDSRDDSAAVARRWGARVIDCPGGGIPAASAAGYDAALGDVIARIDADCVPPEQWLAGIERSLSTRPDVVAFTGTAHFDDGPRALRRLLVWMYLGGYYLLVTPALGHPPVFGSNFAMRRSAWNDIRFAVHRRDAEVHDDLDLSFHLRPDHRVRISGAWPVGISMRPFFDASAFARRMRRGAHTIAVHWPAELPWLRWWRRWQWRARAGQPISSRKRARQRMRA